ncbi:MAG: selenium-dependent xanthine dehydrogenase [Bacilli bacterium]|jgi:aldehyde oxidoreductase
MYTIKVNGQEHQIQNDKKLMRYLRDDLGLTSVKDGCSEGACGTCTVLIDGKATRACVPLLSKLEGKEIITVEGLSEREKDVYASAFARAGAVQCGFCIPGMVISAKALLDRNPSPTRIECADAIKTNICRCTGYKKIIDGIMLAAQMLRDGTVDLPEHGVHQSGDRIKRIDAEEKVLGTGQYPDDMSVPGMLHGGAVRSEYPRAKVVSINTEKARALPGVVGVFTAADVPGNNKIGHIIQDWDVLIPQGGITHYIGDAIVLIAAESTEVLEKAKKLVEIEYEELPGVFSPEDGLRDEVLVHNSKGSNVLAHEHLVRGDADKVIAESAHKVTYHYETPWTEHAFLEPEACLALPIGDVGVYLYSSDQGTYTTQHEVMRMLNLPADQVIVENGLVGGGFGGKEDLVVQHHAALMTWLTKKPVKVKLSRAESIMVHPKRHPFSMDVTTSCDEKGILTAFKAVVVSDTGAYASLGGPVLQRACTHAAGPYNFQTIDIDGKAVYTNNPPAGAFRGFGVTQTNFASEMNINKLAEEVGLSPWEMRYMNAICPGQVLPNGQIADDSTALRETLDAVKPWFDNNEHVGLACAMKNAGVGVGLPDWGRCRLIVRNGRVEIHSGASCIGQGLGTVLTQILSETASIPVEKIDYMRANTKTGPDSGDTSGSRQTLVTGEACRRAAADLAEDLKTATMDELNGKDYLGTYLAKTDPMGADVPYPVSHVAYGYATQLCVLDEDGRVTQMVGAHDVGKAVNPTSVEGQIEGGIIMGMGYALTEQYQLENGIPKSKYGTLGLLKASQVPDVKAMIIEKEGSVPAGGAIGIGEITSIPTAPAIAGAYYQLNGDFQTELPLKNTPYEKKKPVRKSASAKG